MKRSKPNPLMIEFEAHTGLGPTFAARLLGLPYISYAQYRSGLRELKPQHRNHIEVVMLLDAKTLKKRINEVVYAQE